jgi:hypothetical protein
MVERVLLYKLQGVGAGAEELRSVIDRLRARLREEGAGVEASFSAPADEASDHAWDLCVRLMHPARDWAGAEAEALDAVLDDCLGLLVVVRKAWSFRALH